MCIRDRAGGRAAGVFAGAADWKTAGQIPAGPRRRIFRPAFGAVCSGRRLAGGLLPRPGRAGLSPHTAQGRPGPVRDRAIARAEKSGKENAPAGAGAQNALHLRRGKQKRRERIALFFFNQDEAHNRRPRTSSHHTSDTAHKIQTETRIFSARFRMPRWQLHDGRKNRAPRLSYAHETSAFAASVAYPMPQ
jgi:hypothetical protein